MQPYKVVTVDGAAHSEREWGPSYSASLLCYHLSMPFRSCGRQFPEFLELGLSRFLCSCAYLSMFISHLVSFPVNISDKLFEHFVYYTFSLFKNNYLNCILYILDIIFCFLKSIFFNSVWFFCFCFWYFTLVLALLSYKSFWL